MISTHVLDVARGVPASGIDVMLEAHDGAAWTTIGRGTTDPQGRVANLGDARLAAGTYRLIFDTAAYFQRHGLVAFFPTVAVIFNAREAERYHLPLLLSPYGYSTYRGA